MKIKTLSGILVAAMLALAGPALSETRLIMLGTGTPVPSAERAGGSLAVIYDGEAYMFDVGPGSVRNAIKAWKTMDAPELNPVNIKYVFITHLHSDHTLDYPELASTYWWRRDAHIDAYGPKGLNAMTEGYYAMQDVDISLRTSGNQPVKDPTMYKVNVHEIEEPGVIFDKNGVTVEAFLVDHGDIKPAYGFKITTPDKTIVYSGDTRYNENVVEAATGADILVHEVISEAGWKELEPMWQEYHHTSHTLTSELAEVANKAKPGLLVLNHVLTYAAPLDSAKSEVEALYDGKVVLGHDLDEF